MLKNANNFNCYWHGFIFHELAHKFAAIYYGAKAQFRMWPLGLGLAILMALTLDLYLQPWSNIYLGKTLLEKKMALYL